MEAGAHRKQFFESALTRLRLAIVTGELKQGQRLNTRQLAADFNMSFTPVNNAFKVLEKEGLVTVLPRAGVFVTKYNAKDIAELFEARLVLEPEIARQYIRNTTADWTRKIYEIVAQEDQLNLQKIYTDSMLFRHATELDSRFHMHIVDLSENDRLRRMMHDLNVHQRTAALLFGISFEKNPTPLQEHHAIADALAEHDGQKAYDELYHHISIAKGVHLRRYAALNG